MIDIDKLIIALFKSDRFNYQDKQIVRELLQEQGLEYKDGSIVNLELVEQKLIDPDIQKIIDCHFDEMLDESNKENLHSYLYGDEESASESIDDAAESALDDFEVYLSSGSYEAWQMIEMFGLGSDWQKEKIKCLVDKIDVDNHSFEDLEDLYDALCEMTK